MATKDPYIEQLVDRAVAPYRGKLAVAVLEELRELLGDALATHPVVSRLVERGRPHENVLQSDEQERGVGPDDGSRGSGASAPATGVVVPFDKGRGRG
ncbi:MAG: hypothetical protein WKG00_36575 [Polyangiaceae bacterium]